MEVTEEINLIPTSVLNTIISMASGSREYKMKKQGGCTLSESEKAEYSRAQYREETAREYLKAAEKAHEINRLKFTSTLQKIMG